VSRRTSAEDQQPRQRRARSVTEMLLSIVLVLDAILVFFVALTMYGLKVLDPIVALGGGAALAVLFLVAALLLRFSWGIWLGWALQVVLIASGWLLPAMYFIGAAFVGMWVFCFIKGRQIDHAKAAAGLA